jgi:hypothetical protein
LSANHRFTVRDITLKSVESTELGDLVWIGANCRSLLKAGPEVEILDGPPGVTAVVNPAKIVPPHVGCVKTSPRRQTGHQRQGRENYIC